MSDYSERVELSLHTKMSNRDGLVDIADAIEFAIACGHRAIGISDYGTCHSFPEAAGIARNRIQVLYGATVCCCNDVDFDQNDQVALNISLIAKNKAGLKNLYKIISESNKPDADQVVLKSYILNHRDGLLIGTADDTNEIYTGLRCGWKDEFLLKLGSFYDYFVLLPTSVAYRKDLDDIQIEYNKKMLSLADGLGIVAVAAGNVSFLDRHDEEAFHVLSYSLWHTEDCKETYPAYFRTTEEMLEAFSYLEDRAHEVVVDNPNRIADLCEVLEPIPLTNAWPNDETSRGEIRRLAYDRIHRIYGDNLPQSIETQVEFELTSIEKRGYETAFLIAQRIVDECRSKGYPTSTKGSVASSIVAYLVGITEVNPIQPHYICPKCKNVEFVKGVQCGADLPDKNCTNCGTPFAGDGFGTVSETFFGFGGEKVPDIEINVPDSVAEEVIKALRDNVVPSQVIRAGSVDTVQRMEAKVYLEMYLNEHNLTLDDGVKHSILLACEGVKRATGEHPGGFIVIPQNFEVEDFCPTGFAKLSGRTVAHFTVGQLSRTLFKLNISEHKALTQLKELEKATGVHHQEIEMSEHDTFSLFSCPPSDTATCMSTYGVYNFDSAFVRRLLSKVHIEGFNDLLCINGVAHGTGVWNGNGDMLVGKGIAKISELASTRDEIMKVLIESGVEPKTAYKCMEYVRKGTLHRKGWNWGLKECIQEHDLPHWYLLHLERIAYLFPRAHCVENTLLAYWLAWYKVHYPIEFYASYFNAHLDQLDLELLLRGKNAVRDQFCKIQEKALLAESEYDISKLGYAEWATANEFFERGFGVLTQFTTTKGHCRLVVAGSDKLKVMRIE